MSRLKFSILSRLQDSAFVSSGMRRRLLSKVLKVDCDHTASVFEGVFFGSSRVRLMARSFVNVGCLLDGSDWITIGRDAYLAPGVKVLTSSHEVGPSGARAGRLTSAPVVIGDGAWIGAGAIILPGVTIETGCVIAAGAVVTRSTERDGMYAGVPASRKSELPAA